VMLYIIRRIRFIACITAITIKAISINGHKIIIATE